MWSKKDDVYLVRKGDKVYAIVHGGSTTSGNPKYTMHQVPYEALEKAPEGKGAWADTYDFNKNEGITYNSPEQFVNEFLEQYGDRKPSVRGATQMALRNGKLVGYTRDKNTPSGNPAHRGFVGDLPEEGNQKTSTLKRVQTGYSNDIAEEIIKKLGGRG